MIFSCRCLVGAGARFVFRILARTPFSRLRGDDFSHSERKSSLNVLPFPPITKIHLMLPRVLYKVDKKTSSDIHKTTLDLLFNLRSESWYWQRWDEKRKAWRSGGENMYTYPAFLSLLPSRRHFLRIFKFFKGLRELGGQEITIFVSGRRSAGRRLPACQN